MSSLVCHVLYITILWLHRWTLPHPHSKSSWWKQEIPCPEARRGQLLVGLGVWVSEMFLRCLYRCSSFNEDNLSSSATDCTWWIFGSLRKTCLTWSLIYFGLAFIRCIISFNDISGCTRKTRIIDVVYNASNNELVRTKTLVKNYIVLVDSTPYRQWFESHYALPLGRKKGCQAGKLY